MPAREIVRHEGKVLAQRRRRFRTRVLTSVSMFSK
jgi:hypothetical protein